MTNLQTVILDHLSEAIRERGLFPAVSAVASNVGRISALDDDLNIVADIYYDFQALYFHLTVLAAGETRVIGSSKQVSHSTYGGKRTNREVIDAALVDLDRRIA